MRFTAIVIGLLCVFPVCAQPAPDQPAASPPEMVGENIAVVAGHVTFVDMAKAAAEPATWFAAFTAAVVRNVPVDREALRVIADHATEGTIASLMRVDGARQVIELLQPRPGLSRCLIEMRDCGLLQPKDEIVSQVVLKIPTAYVIFDNDRTPAVRTLLSYLESKNVYSIGRFGAWKYSYMEEAILEGKATAEKIDSR